VDKLRKELGQEPLPSLQQVIEERSAQYLAEIRLAGEKKRPSEPDAAGGPPRKKRGRPPGSRTTKPKASSDAGDAESASAA
jgi:hypothetical protein